MKRLHFLLSAQVLSCGILSLCILLLACPESRTNSGGATALDGSIRVQLHDFGLLREGVTVSHAFTIQNNTTEPLKFDKPQMSCGGCIAVKKCDPAISPGKTGTVELSLKTDGKSGLTEQYAILKPNNPGQPVHMLKLNCTVEAIWLDTNSLDLGRVGQGMPEQGAYVLCAGNPKAKITEVIASHEGLKAVVEEASVDKYAQAKGIRSLGYVSISVDEARIKERGWHTETVEVRTNAKTKPTLTFRVDYYLGGGVNLKPELINFGVVRKNGHASGDVAFELEAGRPALDSALTAVQSEHPFVQPSIDLTRKVISATIRPGVFTNNRLVKGSIFVKTGDKAVFSVPYTAYLMAQ